MRIFAGIIAGTLLFAGVASLWAQSPFDGSWRLNPKETKASQRPIVLSLENGEYECSSCNPKIEAKADGQDHPVAGEFFDSINVREIDRNSIEIVAKKSGTPVYKQVDTASADGKSLHMKRTEYSPDTKEPSTVEITVARVGDKPAGEGSGISGSWRIEKSSASEGWLVTTYKTDGDEIKMSSPDGESYTAKLDGKDYPAKGGYVYNAVSLKRLGDRSMEETDKLNGKVISIWRMTVAPDGKTMSVVATWPQTGDTDRFTAEKQQ